jgi:hypothetical protein
MTLLSEQLVTAGPTDDVIYLGRYTKTAHLNGGHDQVFGSNLNNIFFVEPLVTFAEISGKFSGWFDTGVSQFTLKLSSNNKLLGTVEINNASSNGIWSSAENFKFSLPTDSLPTNLELSISSDNGSSFARITDMKIYWLGEAFINLRDGQNTGNINSQLNTQNPDWILAGGGKSFDLNSLNLANRSVGLSNINGYEGIDLIVFPTSSVNYTKTRVANALLIT